MASILQCQAQHTLSDFITPDFNPLWGNFVKDYNPNMNSLVETDQNNSTIKQKREEYFPNKELPTDFFSCRLGETTIKQAEYMLDPVNAVVDSINLYHLILENVYYKNVLFQNVELVFNNNSFGLINMWNYYSNKKAAIAARDTIKKKILGSYKLNLFVKDNLKCYNTSDEHRGALLSINKKVINSVTYYYLHLAFIDYRVM